MITSPMKWGLSDRRTALVLDIGVRYTKCGLAGEARPRSVFATPDAIASLLTVWTRQIAEGFAEVELSLHGFLRTVLLEKLQSTGCGKEIVLVCNVNPNAKLLAVIKFLLVEKFKAKAVTVTCSQLCSLYPTESLTGIVVDCGYQETRCCAVAYGHTLPYCARYAPLGAKAVLECLKQNVLQRNPNITESALTQEILEDLLLRAGFVAGPAQAPATALSTCTLGSVELDPSCCFEVLFDAEMHLEQWCIASCFLDTLLACEMQVRAVVVRNIVLAGGLADTKGFRERFASSVLQLAAQVPRYQLLQGLTKQMSVSSPRFPAETLPWVGASLTFSVLAALQGVSRGGA
eukprot:RCo004004